ncbi:hypothetical protein MKX01_013026 [Papaver californicum]|nr:hypothetical protein MKX01_013026 [Papaver californicum]
MYYYFTTARLPSISPTINTAQTQSQNRSPPNIGEVKINVDGSVYQSISPSAAVARNQEATFLGGESSIHKQICSLVTEAFSFLLGLQLAKKLHLSSCIIDSSSNPQKKRKQKRKLFVSFSPRCFFLFHTCDSKLLVRLRSSNGFPKPFITSLSTAFNNLLHFSDTTTSTTTSTNPKPQLNSTTQESITPSKQLLPPINSIENPISVLNFLRESGFRDTQIRCLLSSSSSTPTPTLFSSSHVEKTVKPKIKVFQDLGLSVPAINISNWLIQPYIKFLVSNARHFMNKHDRVDDEERDLIKKGPNSPRETILGEVRIRFMWTSFGLGMTWFTCYWFSEKPIFLLANPFLTLNSDSHFVCIQLTEALSTYLAAASIACAYFAFPLLSYQLWSFLIPSCYEEQRLNYNGVFRLSGFSLAFFLCLTFSYVVPNICHFLYSMGATSTNLLMIKLQPNIYDFIVLTLRISLISSVCSQVPVILISLLEQKALSVESFTNNCLCFFLYSRLLFPQMIYCIHTLNFVSSLLLGFLYITLSWLV